ncbi:uncharacterized protein SCHCODRAFT_02694696 [Schizophyllum commune H4-8]|nr:uncharacterized protein SCHCODRAFT_02694696 [Schizophyllum commune H4-8]KAI5899355.1 hypothetical protein SCHCODRAFT_02694696 [Schizophyllum commune H4-8]
MHAVLQTPELRHKIFAYSNHSHLAILARTCKTFHESALSLLWRRCENVDHVLNLLPAAIEYGLHRSCENGNTTIPSYLTPEDVIRVQHYTPFIQSLHLDFGYESTRGAPEALAKVVIACGDQNLFPNLRELVYLGPSTFAACLPNITRPPLHQISMAIESMSEYDEVNDDPELSLEGGMELSILFALKARRAHPITSLDLFLPSHCGWPIITLLSGWDHLESLSLATYVDANLLSTMFSLPRLRSLKLGEDPSRTTRLESTNTLDNCLSTAPPTLQSLTLNSWQLSDVADLVSGSRNLRLVKLYVTRVGESRALGRFIQNLRKNPSEQTLRILNITRGADPPMSRAALPSRVDDDCVALGSFQLLFDFRNLVSLILHVPGTTISLRNADLDKMAQSWPQIQRIDIQGAKKAEPDCTVVGLIPFARHCKQLETLSISVRAWDADIPEGADVDCAQFALGKLVLYNSPICSPSEIALFLSRFFPCLHEALLSAFGNPPRGQAEQWRKVDELLPLLCQARLEGVPGGRTLQNLCGRA